MLSSRPRMTRAPHKAIFHQIRFGEAAGVHAEIGDFGFWILDFGFWILDLRFEI
jgi:hypothetical protein